MKRIKIKFEVYLCIAVKNICAIYWLAKTGINIIIDMRFRNKIITFLQTLGQVS